MILYPSETLVVSLDGATDSIHDCQVCNEFSVVICDVYESLQVSLPPGWHWPFSEGLDSIRIHCDASFRYDMT
ncbi:hypothetical protein Pelo_19863 [Pelomyxa schiedti]|nr:hypothetical protein Pelo_19863 [Pelomyxa schiedti]